MVGELLTSDKLHLFLLSSGTWIDENNCLETLENAADLVVCTEEQMHKLSV